ncbi:MAG: hypothetical protein C0614_05520 [Desulfuromonas sp.]|nr:MAG: hypothetical protein C0614_05520 [Desulfuromonas sp.]
MLEKLTKETLLATGNDDDLLAASVDRLAKVHGDKAYREVLRFLVGKNLGAAQSRHYWQSALRHRQTIEDKSGWRLSLRSALLDYLQQQAGEFTNPVIIEAEFLENIRHSSITDGLTGLFDQIYFKGCLDKSLRKSRSNSTFQAAVVLMDLDHFKQYNDRCGHLAGDNALATVADIMRTQVRDGDVVARYGGEEFALFLPRTNRAEAFTIAERIRAAIAQTEFPGQTLLDRRNLTISGGIAVFPEDGEETLNLIARADQELYQAKIRRDCIFPDKSERRRDPRLRISSLVEFTSTGRAFDSGVVFDISRSGLSFSCRDPLQKDECITLRFQKPFWRENFFCEGTVRQQRTLDDIGLNFIGLEFEQLFDEFIRYLPEQKATVISH